MSNVITVELSEPLVKWLEDEVARSGRSPERVVCDELEKLRMAASGRKFMRHAGSVEGPADLSTREGFAGA